MSRLLLDSSERALPDSIVCSYDNVFFDGFNSMEEASFTAFMSRSLFPIYPDGFLLLENRPFWDGKRVVEPDVKPFKPIPSLSFTKQPPLDEIEEKKCSGYIRYCQQQNVPLLSLYSELGFHDSEEEMATCEEMSTSGTSPPATPSTDFTSFTDVLPSKGSGGFSDDEEYTDDDDDDDDSEDELPTSREILEELKAMAQRLKPKIMERWNRKPNKDQPLVEDYATRGDPCMKKIIAEDLTVKCVFVGCDALFRKNAQLFTRHLNAHYPEAFFCPVCEKIYSRADSLKRHFDIKGGRCLNHALAKRYGITRGRNGRIYSDWNRRQYLNVYLLGVMDDYNMPESHFQILARKAPGFERVNQRTRKRP